MKNRSSKIKSTSILLVLILMLMAGLIYINNMNSISTSGAQQVRSLTLIGKLEAKDENSIICSVDDFLAEAAGAVVTARNTSGETIWSKTLVGKAVSMQSEASNLYILDSSKKLYSMSKNGKLLWEKQLEGEIKKIYTDKAGDILIDSNNNGRSKLQIFNEKGMDEGSMSLENAEVIAFASGKEENTLSLIDISSKIIKTKIITLNLRGDMIWSDNLDNQIVPMLVYSKDNALIAVSEKAIYKYKDKSKKQSLVELKKTIYNASIGNEGTVVVVRSREGFEVISYDADLKELGLIELEQAPIGIISGKNNYILFYSEKLLIADMKGSIKAEYKSMPEINKVYFGADGSIISVSNRLIQKLGYK